MRHIVNIVIGMILGFSSGVIIAMGIVAFLLVLGIVPRMTAKTNTRTHFIMIETVALVAIVIGNIFIMWDCYLDIPKLFIGVLSLFYGMFIGCLSIAIAEILDVIPVTRKRLKLKRGMQWVVVSFAIGKMIGSLYYWFYPAMENLCS